MIKATLITTLIYLIFELIGCAWYKSLGDFGKLRLERNEFSTSEWILLFIIAVFRVAAYAMSFVTAFYMIFKYL